MDVSTISKRFAFPEHRDDLLVSEAGRYSVERVVPVHDIPQHLDLVEGMVKKKARWSWWILEYFDTFYSILVKFKTLDSSVKESAWRVVVAGMEQHTTTLARTFTTERLDSQNQLAHLNALQMNVYVLVELYKCFEEEHRSSTQIVTTKKRGNKKQEVSGDKYWTNDDRQYGLQVLRRLLDLNLALLWDPPLVPEDFVDLISGCCYKLFENPDVSKCKKTCEYLFHVLGILIKRYNHCLGASLKIVQLLQQHEHLTTPFASMMLVCVRDYDLKSVVSQIVREIAQIDPVELVRDTNATRNYCTFLLEISETCGSVVLSVISSLLPHLDGDSYTMRNCVLAIFGELITAILSEDNVDENLKQTRESLFDRLELHIHDQNAFVRSKAIQIWTKLIQQRCVPIPRQHTLVDMVVGAIQDKSSNVRKNALVFITTYLGCNPFSDKLSLETLNLKLGAEKEKLGVLQEDVPDLQAPQEGDMEVDLSPEVAQKLEEVQKQGLVVQYLTDCVHFTEQMHRVVLLVSQLLASKSSSDVLESIDFLVSAYEFGLKAAELGVRKMLCLVFNPDQHVKDAVVNAYIRLYIQTESGKRLGPEAVAKNLIAMTYGATLGELMSLETLVKLFLDKEHVSPRVVKVLLDMLMDKTAGTPVYQLNAVVLILTMVASEDHTLVTENINLLLSAGFDGSLSLATNMCVLLQRAVPPKQRKAELPARLEETHRLIPTITNKLLLTFDDSSVDWVGFAEQSVKTIFALSELPGNVCSELLNKLLIKTFPPRQGDLLDTVENDVPPTNHAQAGLHVYRLLSMLGQVALCTLVHLDTSVLEELQRRAAVRDNMEEKKRDKRKHAVDSAEEELGLQGATADDTEAETIRQVLEKEVVLGAGYLAQFVPLVSHICSAPQLYPCARIQNAAVLALCKFMLVSSELCEAKVQLLFTLLEKSTNQQIRCNIMISLHDLVIRFPNLLVNWTSKIYARLRDESVTVRSTTIRVLTNLILNDMVKVKGQISDLAVCLEDEDPKIRSLTQLFFTELSKKTNAIYNVMPDMISHLSDPDTGCTEPGHFKSIMKYLFEFLEKDKQAEALVEKLCHRFRGTRSDAQWHDLSYCLTLLQYNEKCIKKLAENIACYHDKLSDQTVYENFVVLIEKARKTVKTEQKELIDDFEMKVEFCHNRGGDEAPTEEILSQMKDLLTKAPGKPTKAKTSRKKAAKKDSDSEESDKENFVKPAAVIRPRRGAHVKKRAAQPTSSEDSDDLELPEIEQPDASSADSDEAFENSIRGAAGRKTNAVKVKPRVRASRR